MMIDIGIKEYIVRETPIPLAGCKQEVVGEIVRCKDCKHNMPFSFIVDGRSFCKWFSRIVNIDGFCSNGERKDDG